jgi:hypothetical protein
LGKTIDTLVQDIYALFGTDEKFDPNLFLKFGGNLTEIMDSRFHEKRDKTFLRLSNIGKPDRQLWYELIKPQLAEPLPPQALIKFMYGDMQEQLVVLLAKLAGHDVQYEQETVEVNGIKGHLDCLIDGYVVDVKSASRFAFSKFEKGTLLEPGNDAFGYVGQLAGYVHAKTPGKDGYFLAINKDLGHLALLKVDADRLKEYDVPARIDHVKEVVLQTTPPTRCYSDKLDGKSGNTVLDVGCSYCAYKFSCWPNLKTYYYSTGPKYFTHVAKEPRVNDFPSEF